MAPCGNVEAWLPAAAYEHDLTQVFLSNLTLVTNTLLLLALIVH